MGEKIRYAIVKVPPVLLVGFELGFWRSLWCFALAASLARLT